MKYKKTYLFICWWWCDKVLSLWPPKRQKRKEERGTAVWCVSACAAPFLLHKSFEVRQELLQHVTLLIISRNRELQLLYLHQLTHLSFRCFICYYYFISDDYYGDTAPYDEGGKKRPKIRWFTRQWARKAQMMRFFFFLSLRKITNVL